jgi:NAD(P) transhydrogenase subunit alpha
MKKIGILKEQAGESRICMTPIVAKRVIKELEYVVLIEAGAGLSAGFSDEMYVGVGAQILSRAELVTQADVILFINPLESQLELTADKMLIGILNPLFRPALLTAYENKHIKLFSLDLMPRSSKAQSMDVLSSMASLAGYKAVIKASDLHTSVLPMFTTAAGTIKAAKVLVIGAGVAGLQAIATAKRLGAIVEAFDVRKSAGEEVRSLGAKFVEVEGAVENEKAGGYAVEQTEDFIERQKQLIDKHVSEASIVISTANIPGRKAPILIEKESVEKMKPGSVIIDLASEQGGNCVLSKDNEIINHNGVIIIGNSHLARELSATSSQLLSTNYFNYLKHLKWVEMENIQADPLYEGCLVMNNGKMVHERVLSFIK